jgi:urease accessory protein
MTVVDAVVREEALPDRASAYAQDTITLGWEDRVQTHGRRQTDGGLELGLALPRGTVLRAGDCFVLDEARSTVRIVERPQPVFVIEPRSAPEWALYAYHIGNRHQPIMITDRAIVCPDGPGVEQLLQQQRIPHARASLPFTPATAATPHEH